MPGSDALHEVSSSYGYEVTVQQLVTAIRAAGLTIFAQIDHADAARGVGLAMPPTLVIIYGNPRGGTPLMLAAPNAALDLPLRVLVREEGGKAVVAFHPVESALVGVGVPSDLAARLVPAQRILMEALHA